MSHIIFLIVRVYKPRWNLFKSNAYFGFTPNNSMKQGWRYYNATIRYFYIKHYCDVTMGAVASQITSITIVYSTVYTGAVQRKHQSSASLAFVRVIHRWPVNSPHKWLVTQKMFPFDEVVMEINSFLYEDVFLYEFRALVQV